MASLSSNAAGTAVVLQDGAVFMWGQLDAWTADIPYVLGETPVRVERLLSFEQTPLGSEIAADTVKVLTAEIGNFHAAILSETGDLYTCGSGGGHLGLGHANDVRVPTLVGALHGQRVVQVSLGNHMTVALVGTGHVYTFGVSTCGQLGTGELRANISVPTRVTFPADVGKIVFVSAGGVHALATSEHGKLYSWGQNDVGQLGQGDRKIRCEPTVVQGGLAGRRVILTSASALGNAAITDTNELFQWGWNRHWQLAQGHDVDMLLPSRVVGVKNVSVVSCHDLFTVCVVRPLVSAGVVGRGEVWVWGGVKDEWDSLSVPLGIDKQGSLGRGSRRPIRVGGELKHHSISVVGCSHFNIVAVSEEGKVFSWGRGAVHDDFEAEEMRVITSAASHGHPHPDDVLLPRSLPGLPGPVGRCRRLPAHKALAFAMSSHPRLGAGSGLRVLGSDLVLRIVEAAALLPAGVSSLTPPGILRVLGAAFLDPSFSQHPPGEEGEGSMAAGGAGGSGSEVPQGRLGLGLAPLRGQVVVAQWTGPAQEAGVAIADRLISVNGNVVSDLDRVCALVRGPAHEAVHLSLDRHRVGGVWERKEVTVVRAPAAREEWPPDGVLTPTGVFRFCPVEGRYVEDCLGEL